MFQWLFDTESYVPRATCGNWTPEAISFAVLGNVLIALAYYSIPVFLIYLWRKKRGQLRYGFLFFHFALFILLCGTTHVLDALMFVWPAYNLLSVVDNITGLVSLGVLIRLPEAVKYALEWKTPGEYKSLAETLEAELEFERNLADDMLNMIRLLEARISRLDGELRHRGWVDEQTLELNELQEELDALKNKYNDTLKVKGLI